MATIARPNPLAAYIPIRTLHKNKNYTDKYCSHSANQSHVLIRRLRKKDCILANLLTNIET